VPVTIDDGDDERGGDTARIIVVPRAWHGEVSFGQLRSSMRHLMRTAHQAKPVTPGATVTISAPRGRRAVRTARRTSRDG
jgi:hypothetical protein